MNDQKNAEVTKHNYFYNKERNQSGNATRDKWEREYRTRILGRIKYGVEHEKKLGSNFFMAAFPQFKHYPALIKRD